MRLAHVKSVLLSVGIHAIIGISGPSCRHRDGERFELKSFFVYEYPWGVSRQLLKPRGWDVAKRSRQWEPVNMCNIYTYLVLHIHVFFVSLHRI